MSKKTLKDFFNSPSQGARIKSETPKKNQITTTSPLQSKSNNVNGKPADDIKVNSKLSCSMTKDGKSKVKKRPNQNKVSSKPKRRKPEYKEEEDEEEMEISSTEESDDDYKPEENKEISSDDDEDDNQSIASDILTPEESDTDETKVLSTPKPKKSKAQASTPKSTPVSMIKKSTPSSSKKASALLRSFQFDPEPENESATSFQYFHETLNFLKPGSIKDKKQRPVTHPEYDPTSVYVPTQFINQQTPAMQQWWQLKSSNYNVVLFFKVGKFYELYHMDADVGVKELGLTYMRGAFAHCGFPEVAYGRYSSQLVAKGYVAARVEQTEKPNELQQRIKGKSGLSKAEKTLRREICQMTTIGTQQLTSFDGVSLDERNAYMLAVMEQISDDKHEFGVCLVDTLTCDFRISQFSDDRCCSRLATILAHFSPAQVLHERCKHSDQLDKILRNGLSAVMKVGLRTGTEFWDATKTIRTLQEEKYFEKWPDTLEKLMNDGDVIGCNPHPDYHLAWSCFGACIYYLRRCLIDHQVISNGKFQLCDVNIFNQSAHGKQIDPPQLARNMIIDSVTLANLEILLNSDGSEKGTLASCLDNCNTPFGKRLFRQWICAPLCRVDDINRRLDAVEELIDKPELTQELVGMLRKLSDVERMIMRIHGMSKGCMRDDHPDMRAVMFEEKIYQKKTVNDFVSLLEQFDRTFTTLKRFDDVVVTCDKLRSIIVISSEGFPDLGPIMSRWKKSFDYEKAKETGKIAPRHGTNIEYDEALDEIDRIQIELDQYLHEQQNQLRCNSVVYKGANNKRYQLEVPDKVSRSLIPSDYVVCGQRKNFRCFRTPRSSKLLESMIEAECRRDKAQSETLTIVFREFKKDYQQWYRAVQCLSQLDCIISLAEFSRISSGDGPTCRPDVQPPSMEPFLELRQARHPSLNKKSLFSGGDFIPNDTTLGGKGNPRSMLLTGPNMGGKSTLMRQVGLHVILAQIGCFVPAQSFSFSVCDRVFTRLGASDRIMFGESTFYVELSETCSILKHATPNSLILLDELGRGTATYDGTAIASAVLDAISCPIKLGARTIFSTHYHTLIDDFKNDPNVSLGHMSCMVDTDETTETISDEDTHEKITFLYKLVDGACPKSYGFHAATLAGIPHQIVNLARKKAEKMEEKCKKMKLFRGLISCSDPLDQLNLLSLD